MLLGSRNLKGMNRHGIWWLFRALFPPCYKKITMKSSFLFHPPSSCSRAPFSFVFVFNPRHWPRNGSLQPLPMPPLRFPRLWKGAHPLSTHPPFVFLDLSNCPEVFFRESGSHGVRKVLAKLGIVPTADPAHQVGIQSNGKWEPIRKKVTRAFQRINGNSMQQATLPVFATAAL